MKKIIEALRSANMLIAKAIRRAVKNALASDFLLSASGIIAVGAVLVSPPPLWSIPLAFSTAGVIVYGANVLVSSALGSIWNIFADVAEKFRRPVMMKHNGEWVPDAGIDAPSVARMGR